MPEQTALEKLIELRFDTLQTRAEDNHVAIKELTNRMVEIEKWQVKIVTSLGLGRWVSNILVGIGTAIVTAAIIAQVVR